MKNIVIFGAPGSGKGTQSDLLIEHYGLGHISTGDVLRSEIKKGTELGKTAQSYIDKGNLIPDDLMISILANVYDSFGRGHKGVIFDGFPRTIPQAEALKKMLDERGDKVAAMLELDVPEDELMKRLIKRGKDSGRADDNEMESVMPSSHLILCRPLLQCMNVKCESEVAQVVPDSWRPHGLQPIRLLRPWGFPGKSTGVGCHCLLQKA